MLASRRGFLGGIASLICAPAVVRADSLMKLHQIPERYATVWGVGHDLEVVEHVIWSPQDAWGFAKFDGGGIDKFREVTEVVYTNPIEPLSVASPSHWTTRPTAMQEWFANQRKAIINENTGFTNVAGFDALKDWGKERKGQIYVPQHVFLNGV